jgi:hypothetical protein
MSDKNILSFHTLPVELVYRIFDNLDVLTILLSLRDVCIRLNIILDTYHRFKVKKIFSKKANETEKFEYLDIHCIRSYKQRDRLSKIKVSCQCFTKLHCKKMISVLNFILISIVDYHQIESLS